MGILKKNPNKVEIEIETDEYKKNFNSELMWKDEVDLKEDNVLNDYNSAEALAVEVEKSKRTYEKQSIHELLANYVNIIYNDIKELAKTNIIQHTIYLFNSTLIA